MRARNGRMQALKCSKTRKVNTSKYDMNYIIYIWDMAWDMVQMYAAIWVTTCAHASPMQKLSLQC
jgi:hypothetical protein